MSCVQRLKVNQSLGKCLPNRLTAPILSSLSVGPSPVLRNRLASSRYDFSIHSHPFDTACHFICVLFSKRVASNRAKIRVNLSFFDKVLDNSFRSWSSVFRRLERVCLVHRKADDSGNSSIILGLRVRSGLPRVSMKSMLHLLPCLGDQGHTSNRLAVEDLKLHGLRSTAATFNFPSPCGSCGSCGSSGSSQKKSG